MFSVIDYMEIWNTHNRNIIKDCLLTLFTDKHPKIKTSMKCLTRRYIGFKSERIHLLVSSPAHMSICPLISQQGGQKLQWKQIQWHHIALRKVMSLAIYLSYINQQRTPTFCTQKTLYQNPQEIKRKIETASLIIYSSCISQSRTLHFNLSYLVPIKNSWFIHHLLEIVPFRMM